MGAINILFLTSVPAQEQALDTNAEFRKIDDALEDSPNSARFRLFRHARLRREELERTLSTFQPHIVHFSGHGNSVGALILEDQEGRRWDLDRDTLRTVFKAYGQSVKLAVLNACHSEVAGNTLREVVPYVIGNAVAVYDDAAIDFATTFYRVLFQGETLHKSFRAACQAAGMHDASRGQVPQLLDTPHHSDPRQVKPLEHWGPPDVTPQNHIENLVKEDEELYPDQAAIDSLKKQLSIQQTNLNRLNERKAMYAMDIPLYVENQIEAIQKQIETIQHKLDSIKKTQEKHHA